MKRKAKRSSDLAVCQLCGKEFKMITHKHLKYFHNMTIEEYKEKFPNSPMVSITESQRRKEKSKKSWKDPDIRERRTKSLQEISQSKEYKEKKSKIAKEVWNNPEYKKEQMKSNSFFSKENQSKAGKKACEKNWSDPEHRKYVSNYMKTNNPMFDPENKKIHWKATHTEEFREKSRETGKKCMTPEKQKKMSKTATTSEANVKRSNTLKVTIAKMKKENPEEFKKKYCHSEGLKKKWQSYTPEERMKRVNDSMGFGRNSFMGRAKTGYFYSEKNKRKIFYRSSFELAAYQILEQIPHVIKYDTECLHIPYVINGEKHTYIPDILVTYKDGSQSIIEIKPSWIVEEMDQKLTLKIESAKEYCNQHDNINFILLTEEDL